MRKAVILPRGIPGSGKSTWTKEQLDKHPNGTAVRINNDDLSAMLWNQHWANFFFSPETRKTLEELRSSMLRTFLKQDFITHIYVDNTNLNPHVVRVLERIAHEFDAEFIVDDTLLSVPVEVCIERDSKREKPVGEKVIRDMHEKALKLKPWNYVEVPTIEKYENDKSLPQCIIVDIDGTLAHMNGRNAYDWKRVGEDTLDESVADIVRAIHSTNCYVFIMSGRDSICRNETEQWLNDKNIPYFDLFMRKQNDMRPDWIIKNELFQEHIAGKYRVSFVLDDRNQVVNLWRNKLGLKTLQCEEGDF